MKLHSFCINGVWYIVSERYDVFYVFYLWLRDDTPMEPMASFRYEDGEIRILSHDSSLISHSNLATIIERKMDQIEPPVTQDFQPTFFNSLDLSDIPLP